MKDGKRSFTIVKIISKGKKRCADKEGGRYISTSPVGAARKVFTRAVRDAKICGVCSATIIVKETTAGSKDKHFQYKIKKTKLKTPIKMMRNGEEVEIKFETKAKSAPLTMTGGKKKKD